MSRITQRANDRMGQACGKQTEEENLKEMMPQGRPGSKWNNETDVGGEQDGVEWVRLLQDGDKYRDVCT